MIDTTYKTNRFNFPLVDITGQTCNNQTFVARAFMRESEKSFVFWNLERTSNCGRNQLDRFKGHVINGIRY